MDEGRRELELLVATLRGRDSPNARHLAAAVNRWRRPPRIQVTGRARVGKTTVQRALALISAEETTSVDLPERADPELGADLVIYVLGATLHPADRAALDAATERTPATEYGAAVVDAARFERAGGGAWQSGSGPRESRPSDRILLVLNKADAIGTRWSDAVTAADGYAAATGLRTFPVTATLAAHTRSGILTAADLATLRRHRGQTDPAFALAAEYFTAPAFGPDTVARATLLDRWTLPGIACARAALRHHPDLTPRRLLQILHAASGIDPLNQELQRRYEHLTAIRDAEFLDALADLADPANPDAPVPDGRPPGARPATADIAATDRELIARYLRSGEARGIALRAGRPDPGPAAPTPARPEPPDPNHSARRWGSPPAASHYAATFAAGNG